MFNVKVIFYSLLVLVAVGTLSKCSFFRTNATKNTETKNYRLTAGCNPSPLKNAQSERINFLGSVGSDKDEFITGAHKSKVRSFQHIWDNIKVNKDTPVVVFCKQTCFEVWAGKNSSSHASGRIIPHNSLVITMGTRWAARHFHHFKCAIQQNLRQCFCRIKIQGVSQVRIRSKMCKMELTFCPKVVKNKWTHTRVFKHAHLRTTVRPPSRGCKQ